MHLPNLNSLGGAKGSERECERAKNFKDRGRIRLDLPLQLQSEEAGTVVRQGEEQVG